MSVRVLLGGWWSGASGVPKQEETMSLDHSILVSRVVGRYHVVARLQFIFGSRLFCGEYWILSSAVIWCPFIRLLAFFLSWSIEVI